MGAGHQGFLFQGVSDPFWLRPPRGELFLPSAPPWRHRKRSSKFLPPGTAAAGTEGHPTASPRRLTTPSFGGRPRPQGPERGGSVRLVLGHPRLGGDGDMESGAYGAANAGGSFDLRRFLSQPQVVTRIVSMVSRPGGIRSRAPRPPGPVGRRLPSATGGCGRTSQAGRRARAPHPFASPSTPGRASCRLSHCVAPDLVSSTQSRPPRCGMSPEVLCGGRPVALLAVGGASGATPLQVACTPRFPAWGIHLEGTF